MYIYYNSFMVKVQNNKMTLYLVKHITFTAVVFHTKQNQTF